MSLITFKHASEFYSYSFFLFRDWCALVRVTTHPRNYPVIHKALNDRVVSPSWQMRLWATPAQGCSSHPQVEDRQLTGIWHPTQEFSLVFQQKVYFLCGRVWWIFLIFLFSVLGSKQHIPFHSLQCFINNKIASLCLSCKYLDSGTCLQLL